MSKITDEELDKFIKYTKSVANKAPTEIGTLMINQIAMMGDELKLRRSGKVPKDMLPDRYLDIMIKDNKQVNGKGSKEVIQICSELKKLRRI